MKKHDAKFGFGGYDELRTLYRRSDLFSSNLAGADNCDEPRRLHIGIDIWGEEGTEVFAPLDGVVHSFAFNNNYGDYGATIILSHQIESMEFYTLYGHVSFRDLNHLEEGRYISQGQEFAHFGKPGENGYWPPHLHFQIIKNISTYKGDYPGVCKKSERKRYLENSPDPDVILGMRKFMAQ